ncbi:hypothetical protein JMF89_15115 [Clostridiaceae bacterium UIB06]|nr:hypothetical protein [Clostridiaceae bacterium UIB06]
MRVGIGNDKFKSITDEEFLSLQEAIRDKLEIDGGRILYLNDGDLVIRKNSIMDFERKKDVKVNFKTFISEIDLNRFINIIHRKLEIRDVTITRLIYLASYMNYQGKLIFDNGVPIRKRHLEKLLMIKKKEAQRFYKELTEQKILMEFDNSLYIVKDYIFKGKPMLDYNEKIEYSRMFVKTIRDIYESTKNKAITTVYKLLPYISYAHNSLCLNANASYYEPIEAMNWEVVGEILGISAERAKKKLLKYKLLNGEKLFVVSSAGKNKYIYVNPRLVFKNNSIDTFAGLLINFDSVINKTG